MGINFDSFSDTQEWQEIVKTLDRMIVGYTDEIIEAGEEGNVAKTQHLTGRIAALREVRNIPALLKTLQKGTKPNAEESD